MDRYITESLLKPKRNQTVNEIRKYKKIISEKTAEELRQIIASYGLNPEGKSTSQMEQMIAMAMWAQNHPGEEFPEEFSPMLAKDSSTADSNWVRNTYRASEWYIETKLDGMRAVAQFYPNGKFSLTSRSRSAVDFLYPDNSSNVLGFQNIKNPFKGKTVLDGELMSPTNSIPTLAGTMTTTSLQAVVSLVNMPKEESLKIQRRLGSLYYVVFDILYFNGDNVQNLPFEQREVLASTAVDLLVDLNPGIPISKNPTIKDYDDPWQIFKDYVDSGGEGVMFKRRSGVYRQDYRSGDLQKLKGFKTVDGFITGQIAAKAGSRYDRENLIAGVKVSAYVDGIKTEIADVSGLTLDQRREMTVIDDNGAAVLDPEMVGRVVELIGQQWSPRGKLVSARITNWRDDRVASSCQLTADDIRPSER